ncbi:Sensor histidine kinase ResE [bioreactor metagenome]|uniref:histidine kinase n=2 Tax=root TaxID=1 RepID=A0A645GIC9_9ZZZZ
MESGRFSMNVTEVDLNEVIRASIVKFETKINDKKLRVDISLDSEHQYVAADRDRLIQVVTNLLDNAVKHSPAEGHVEVSTKVKGKKVTVAIYNDGMPISDADLKNIWSRFYKADRSRTQKESTGLGLPIVRNILSQLGENVWVENRETGVVFQFTLSKT